MGKKRKISCMAKGEDMEGKTEDANILYDTNFETNKKVKKANKQKKSNSTENTEDILAIETPETEESLNTKSKNKNKIKRKLEKTHLDGDDTKSINTQQNMNSTRATKIRFVDDAPQVVATGLVHQSTKVSRKKGNQSVQLDEEEVNDEDIDKFCEELTEEDNAQFDDWVKLIEAKLHSKKNK